jgi:hypothetical protein
MEIKTLIPDIQKLVTKKDGWFTPELSHEFAHEIASRLQTQLGQPKQGGRLRLSQMGPRCPCALWYSYHHPELAEALPPWAEVKYSFGHIIEGLAISFAKAAGHSVTGEQDELRLDDIVGHRDAVIDGAVVDVKSTSSPGFIKFKTGSIRFHDDFGYLDQLDGYVVASLHDPLVTVKDRGYLLAIDKTLGHMCLYEHIVRETHIRERIQNYKSIVALDRPPQCTCETTSHGASGNTKLGLTASYNAYKYCCWPHLRTFIYAKEGPVYLTRVVRKPDVIEVDRYGNVVYN